MATEVMRIDGSDNQRVGIGTTSPSLIKLDVVGNKPLLTGGLTVGDSTAGNIHWN